MPRRIALSSLNASTMQILNTIRANASYEYQNLVPKVQTANDIPKVGEVLYGTPALANQFVNALVNRIALVRVQSANFNNPYEQLKKGYLMYGETVEEIFTGIIKAMYYDPEKAESRELKRYLPDVKSVFHAMNWRVMYPITIQDEDLRMAFLSLNGVQDLIGKIIDQVYTGANYDEWLLFKYLLIKAMSHGKITPKAIGDISSGLNNAAINFRGVSNNLTFMSKNYNEAGVRNVTPKNRQIIFMDSMFNAQYDVDVLAAAFNMDRATFSGQLYLVDDWTSFDNERFDFIREQSDGIEEVTPEELALLADVKAVLIDSEWFQVYDNLNKFTEKYVSSGLYWNYFYHTWKTVSYSPFANAVMFVQDSAAIAAPETVTVEVVSKSISEEATVFTLGVQDDNATLANGSYKFIQGEAATTAGIAIHPYGAVIFPAGQTTTTLQLEYSGLTYTTTTALTTSSVVGDTIEFTKT